MMDESKRFWLTTSQRDTLVNALLSKQQGLEDAVKKDQPKEQYIRDMVERSKQETDMLVSLLKVQENERI